MAKINEGSFRDWNDGEIIKARDYKQEREIIRVAVNDTHDRFLDEQANFQQLKDVVEENVPKIEAFEELATDVEQKGNYALAQGDYAKGQGNAIQEALEKSVNIIKSPTIPEGIVEGRLWADTSDNTYQGTVFDELSTQLAQTEQRHVNIDKYENLKVAVADGWDYAPVIQKALNENKNIVITGNYKTGRFIPKSGQEILLFGELTSLSGLTNCLIEIVNLEDVTIRGIGRLVGNAENTFTGIKVNNSRRIKIFELSLKDFKNKGIDIFNGSSDIVVKNNFVEGANSVTGAGISVFGATTSSCIIVNNFTKNCRFGISFNGGFRHIIESNICIDSSLAGIALDGIVTDSGDGTKETLINNNIVKGTTATTYGGIYLGNGSSFNTISNNLSVLNARSGIRIVGGVGFENKGNKLVNNTSRLNSNHGCELGYAPFSVITNNVLSNNTQRGLTAVHSDNSMVNDNSMMENGTVGMQWQSGKSSIQNNKIKFNNQGLIIAYGGSSPIDNLITGNDFTENITSNVTTVNDPNTFRDNLGYRTRNFGTSVAVSSGGTIAHGLAKTPTKVFVNQKGSAVSVITGLTVEANATHITVTFGGGGQGVFYWEAETT